MERFINQIHSFLIRKLVIGKGVKRGTFKPSNGEKMVRRYKEQIGRIMVEAITQIHTLILRSLRMDHGVLKNNLEEI